MRFTRLLAASITSAALLGSTAAMAQEKLTVWWVKGFYKAEDEALFAACLLYTSPSPRD